MALVSYDYSDASSDESDNEITLSKKPSVVELIPKENGVHDSVNVESTAATSELFSSLPQPKQISMEEIKEDDDDVLLQKKVNVEKPSSKKLLTIPRLSDYNSDEEDINVKKIKPEQFMQKASGLFCILPPPKTAPIQNSKPKFDAAVVSQKNLVPRVVKNNSKKLTENKKRQHDSDDEDGNVSQNFFSSIFMDDKKINYASTISAVPKSLNMQVDSAKPVSDVTNAKTNDYFANLVATASTEFKMQQQEEEEVQLDDAAMKELCGKNHKRIKNDDIKVVNLNNSEIMSSWDLKALTEEPVPTPKKDDEPSLQSKRKHQITYLAYQAKMNEQQLKNQWALNRMTRKQTQAKYGF